MNTEKELEFYTSITKNRQQQSKDVYSALKDHFSFDKVECIETGASQNLDDGCFGLYLAKIAESTNGIYHSVDIDGETVEKSKKVFREYLPDFRVNHHILDSVSFLESYTGAPNLVHLDSFDLNLKNPIPSMLHGWLEFSAIKDKMPSGSIILVDDNYLRGTWVQWKELVNNKLTGNSDIIDVNYDTIGKGSLIYHWCEKSNTDWDLIGDYKAGINIKIIIKKR